jgi:AmiR/NasT family two-component response regulator
MISAVIHVRPGPDPASAADAAPSDPAARLAAELLAADVQVLGTAASDTLVHDVRRFGADVLVCQDPAPDDGLFDALATLQAQAPLPVLLFTTGSDGRTIERAVRCGVHGYVTTPPTAAQLPLHIALARARHGLERELREALSDVTGRFEERKLVDRAKGLLMRARQMHEDDAFAVLRSAAMQSAQRIGDVARRVLDSARAAADVNRSGQLRMLSQRMVKLQALRCLRVRAAESAALLAESVQRADATVQGLARDLPAATFGDLVDGVVQAWAALQPALQASPQVGALAAIDGLAERMLLQGDRLTAALEAAGSAGPLRLVNVCGRQRMLSQRIAKHRLLAVLPPPDGDAAGHPAAMHTAAARAAQVEYERGLAWLEALPLSDRDIRAALAAAAAQWQALLAADPARPAGRDTLATSSEALLGLLDGLTGHYEHHLQVLLQ